MGIVKQAKTHADKAAKIGTKDALLSDMIGVVYSRVGAHELAIPFFEKAAKKKSALGEFSFQPRRIGRIYRRL